MNLSVGLAGMMTSRRSLSIAHMYYIYTQLMRVHVKTTHLYK